MPPIIEVQGVSKRYKLGRKFRQSETFREFFLRKIGESTSVFRSSRDQNSDPADPAQFWALKDICFDVSEGDVVGIIGRNGAGKSTLLKILSRITDPSEGCVHIRGRMGSLLEVGTGFHPELTGRENIFLNGAILGMRKTEIQAKFDEIVAFSEIEKFLDTPVKHYSSGMYVRLAFAVASNLNPEILIVDEVLAVGDVAFQRKCLGKMNEISKNGRTVLFVSHNLPTVENLCTRGIVLDQGQLAYSGSSKDAVLHYLNSVSGAGASTTASVVDLSKAAGRSPNSRPLITQLELFTTGDQPAGTGVRLGDSLKLRFHFNLEKPTDSFNIGIGFNNIMGTRVFTASSMFEANRTAEERVGQQVYTCEIPSFTLVPGDYNLRIWLDINGVKADLIEDAVCVKVLDSDFYGTGRAPWNGICVLKQRWALEQPAAVAVG